MTDRSDVSGSAEQAVLVAQSFVALADTLVDDFDVVELLDRLVADTVDLLGIDTAAILLVNRDHRLEIVAGSDEASRTMELVQLQSRSGPCIEAIQTGLAVEVTDRDEILRRWPVFGRAVIDAGFTALYAIPLRLRADMIGALNLYGAGTATLSEFDQRLAQALADVATIAILQQRKYTRATVLAEQLQLALNTRIVVEQAKGVIAEFGGVDMAAAFGSLRAYSRRQRVKLGAVAESLVQRELDPAEVIAQRSAR